MFNPLGALAPLCCLAAAARARPLAPDEVAADDIADNSTDEVHVMGDNDGESEPVDVEAGDAKLPSCGAKGDDEQPPELQAEAGGNTIIGALWSSSGETTATGAS